MLKSKAFAKVTRKGNVVKVVKEHYLRTDITCGVVDCSACSSIMADTSISSLSIPLNRGDNRTLHYILPDTNICLHQIDLLEHKAITNVIILSTVLEEVKANSLSVYNRLRAIIPQFDKHFHVFLNEHHKDTFVEREENESPNDRNDRAIRIASAWYNEHLKPLEISVILVTNDIDNKLKAAEAIPAMSLADYISAYTDYPEMIDMMAAVELRDPADVFAYEEYLPLSILTAGINSAKYYQGALNVSTHNCFEGSIFTELPGELSRIEVIGREAMNRAVHSDIVVVELLPKEKWNVVSVAIKEDEEAEDSLIPSDQTVPSVSALRPVGKIVGIIKRKWRSYCCHVLIPRPSNLPPSAMQSIIVSPMDRRIPRIRIRTRQINTLKSQKIVVAIDSWDKNSKYPSGHFVQALGEAGDRETETEALLLEHDVEHSDFSKAVLACLPSPDWKPAEADMIEREDFRELNICSIDPPGCTDIDDALHCLPLSNGNFQVGVHIADVTHFVKPFTPLDAEAASRGTTVYLVNRRIDMLPGLLGTNLCSLRSNVERFAFSCVWEMTPEAEIISVKYTKSLIKSKASLTYEQAQNRIDDKSLQDPLTLGIRQLNILAKKMRAKRFVNGALTLASPEVRFHLEHESQDPIDVEMKELKETNALVEEFMLLANISVARFIYEHFAESAILRRHPHPPQENFDGLKNALREKGFDLDSTNSKRLSDSLDAIVSPSDSYFNKLVRILTTRCMMQAVYFCSGTVGCNDFYHYGLAADIYTHFTSPIRRYADVIVHRLLHASISSQADISSDALAKSKIADLCENLNYRHRMAQRAGRASVELFTVIFFKGKILQEEAYVIRVVANGIVAFIPKYGIEGIVYLDENADECEAKFDAHKNHFILKNGGILDLFKKIKVEITVTENQHRPKLSLALIDPMINKKRRAD